MQQLQQQDWCEQQIREKQLKKDVEKANDMMWANQIKHFEAIQTEDQDVHNRLRHQRELDAQKVNGILANERKEREQAAHDARKAAEAREVQHWQEHDWLKENPATEQSALAPHRVIPYHFKGFQHHPHQTEQVNLERS